MSAVEIPPGGTILDTFKKSFSDVPVNAEKDNAISTVEFLDAAESLVTIFGSYSYLLELPHITHITPLLSG